MLCDSTGRHLVMMPHIERSTFNGTGRITQRRNDEVSPWHEAFVNAKKWIDKKINYFDLYIESVLEKRALFFGSLFKLF
jgi:hypothetical protein